MKRNIESTEIWSLKGLEKLTGLYFKEQEIGLTKVLSNKGPLKFSPAAKIRFRVWPSHLNLIALREEEKHRVKKQRNKLGLRIISRKEL